MSSNFRGATAAGTSAAADVGRGRDGARDRVRVGAVVLRATRQMSYRETEDQIRHYGPARYLCALTETSWSPDANTIQDFEQLLGEDGMKRLNEYVVIDAVKQNLADPRLLVADTTAQEAACQQASLASSVESPLPVTT